MLRIVVVTILVAATMPLVASTSYAWRVPETLSAVVKAGRSAGSGLVGRGIVESALPFRATELAVTWRGAAAPPRIRTSSDGVTWSGWKQPTESEDMFDAATGTHYSDLLQGGDSRWAQILPTGPVHRGSLALAVINTKDGPLRSVRLSRTALAATAQPSVISRRAWGADESIRKGQPGFTNVNKIFVHHTVTPNNADPASTIRAIYAYHVGIRGWDDIGYNYLIDSRGNTYEGRYSRPLASGEQPTHEDSQGRGVVGAHTEGHNIGSTGIALLGNAETAAPTRAAVDSLVNLIAWKADRHNIDPMGSGPQSGSSGSFPNVAGHSDAPRASTECPGARLHPMLPSVRQRAKQIVESSRGAGPGGAVGDLVRPILNAPAPGLGDSVAEVLKGLGL